MKKPTKKKIKKSKTMTAKKAKKSPTMKKGFKKDK